jgi:hypothetical protein
MEPFGKYECFLPLDSELFEQKWYKSGVGLLCCVDDVDIYIFVFEVLAECVLRVVEADFDIVRV